ncbi:MAG: radical SAM protein [Planctomycetia bacterium]|nr:radical SAM protein [Planctomycetia bacterium]
MPLLPLRDYRFLGTTQSLCPDCLSVVPAKIVARDGRVYFRKQCEQHGPREDFVCSDERWFDRMEFSLPGRVPARFAIEPRRGCPYDCGLCTEHEQHTCIAVLEITSSCNLTCPMCYASSAPGGTLLPLGDCRRAIDHLVAAEGRPEILQLSGGEPTVHPQFVEILDYACSQPIDMVMINTNGIRLATDRRLREELARRNRRCEVYLQFDGFDDGINRELRGEALLESKLKAIELLGELDVRIILVTTVQAGVNDDQYGKIARFGLERPWITGASFQPATYVGRHVLPESLERRVTFPDVIRGIVEQTSGAWNESDFLPLPCAHPNAHSLAYAYREGSQSVPLTRFIDIANHLDLLANGITFNRGSARSLIGEFLSRQNCGCSEGCGPVAFPGPRRDGIGAHLPVLGGPDSPPLDPQVAKLAASFFRRCLAEDLSPADVFRITTTSFMDAYNFDIRQLMKSCVHHLLPSGHLIPFCAYNLLYRDGHVPLPPLVEPAAAELHQLPAEVAS